MLFHFQPKTGQLRFTYNKKVVLKLVCIMKNYLFATLLAFVALSCTDELQTELEVNDLIYQNYIPVEVYQPVGEVKEINLANGMTVYKDDYTYYLGDMLFSKEQIEAMNSLETRSAGLESMSNLWSENNISYYCRPNVDADMKSAIVSGLDMISKECRLKFTEVKYETSKGINFNQNTEVNSSFIGKQDNGNLINIASRIPGVVAHEVMHSLGIFHEQSRTDRDMYVKILYENVMDGEAHNFDKYPDIGYEGGNIGTYDYNSIMHYGSSDFSKNGGYTILKLDGSRIYKQRSYLTEGDKEGLNYLYGPKGTLSSVRVKIENNSGPEWIDERHIYRNTINFKEPLKYPKYIIVKLEVSTTTINDGPNISTYTRFFVAPAGSSYFELPDTYWIRQEDMGQIRLHRYETYKIAWI